MTPRACLRTLSLLALLIGVLGPGGGAHGHALDPGYLELRLIDRELYAVLWKVPAAGERPMNIAARLPARCEPRTPGQPAWQGGAYFARWTARCPGGLQGGVIRIDGLEQTSTDVLVRFDFADGTSEARRLTPGNTAFTVPTQPSQVEVVRTYLLLGVEHIGFGVDHLLFVLALMLLVQGTAPARHDRHGVHVRPQPDAGCRDAGSGARARAASRGRHRLEHRVRRGRDRS